MAAHLSPEKARPLSDADYAAGLPAALLAAQDEDSDLDGVTNTVEISMGSNPSDGKDFPQGLTCVGKDNPAYKVCEFDLKYAGAKVMLDFCGVSPTREQLDTWNGDLDATLDGCLQSEFWRGKNGQLWQLAHKKVRPVGSVKDGPEERGDIPLADYYDDYALYAWSQTDDHDARDVLTADFYVQRLTNPTRYERVADLPNQFVSKDKRAGNITTGWMLSYFVMFTPLPRNIASQVYRAYLGLDIAKQEGIYPVAGEPVDYDNKGVTDAYCAQCHATLDPLSYPFRNYNGLTGGNVGSKRYVPDRLNIYFNKLVASAPRLNEIPEAGRIFNQPVANVREWAQVAANSDQFAVNTVMDYWKLLLGAPPTPEQNDEFVQLWKRLRGENNYRVQKMLHELVHTEAYGVP